jgi:hypothetical protein
MIPERDAPASCKNMLIPPLRTEVKEGDVNVGSA